MEKWSYQIFTIRLPYQNGTWKFGLQSAVSGEVVVAIPMVEAKIKNMMRASRHDTWLLPQNRSR